MTESIADTFHRTALIGIHDHSQPTLQHALLAHEQRGVLIVAGADALDNLAGQAALSSAVATAVRAFGIVRVAAEHDPVLLAGPRRGQRASEMIHAEGAVTVEDPAAVPPQHPVILLGDAEPPRTDRHLMLRATWTGWTAHVRPATDPAPDRSTGNVLAGIAAGALAVHEAFGALTGRPGSDAGHRELALNLWRPGDETDDGPTFTHAPASWWLLGLGHLGQANAWTLAWLTYADPRSVEIVLQDTDRANDANHSTGLLTPRRPHGVRKTRLIAAALDPLGFDTTLIERRLDATSRLTERDGHVALGGVDNLAARRLLSEVGWPLVIDAGLGAGPTDYNAILLRRFPAQQASGDVPAWREQPSQAGHDLAPALAELHRQDPCGSVRLSGVAAGAAFVGVVAACLGIAQSVRAVMGAGGYDIVNLHLGSDDVDRADATRTVEAVSAGLDFRH